jgi:hypothetical protein
MAQAGLAKPADAAFDVGVPRPPHFGAQHRVHALWREITHPIRRGGLRRTVEKVLPPAIGRRPGLSTMLVAPRSCYCD